MSIKRLMLLFLMLSMAFFAYGAGEGEGGEKAEIWSFATSVSGSSPYIMGGVVCDVANNNYKGLQISPQVSAGFEENIGLVAKKDVSIAETSNITVLKTKAYEKFPNLTGVFNCLMAPIQVVVDGKKGYKSISDLKGATINIGAPGQATRNIAQLLLSMYGIKEGDYKISSLTTGDSAAALKDGQVDACFILGNTPMPNIAEAAVRKKIDLLPISGPEAKAFNEKIGKTMVSTSIPAGTYKGIDHKTETLAGAVVIIADKDLDADLVYEFTKSVCDHLDDLKAIHDGFSSLELDSSLISGWGNLPLHSGAEKYFKEVGIIK